MYVYLKFKDLWTFSSDQPNRTPTKNSHTCQVCNGRCCTCSSDKKAQSVNAAVGKLISLGRYPEEQSANDMVICCSPWSA